MGPGLGGTIDPERVVLAGVRDLDAGERELLERHRVDRDRRKLGRDARLRQNALDGAPVFIHLDLDVIDPESFPAPRSPEPGGLAADKLYDLLEAVSDECEVVGFEVTAFEAPEDESSARRARRP